MADFTSDHAKQLADDAVIRNLLARREVYGRMTGGGPGSLSAMLLEIAAKYANITDAAALRRIVEQALAEDESEMRARIEEMLPPAT